MAKEEKPLEYQRRIRDTKGVAQRLDLHYLNRPSLLGLLRSRVTWAAVALAVVVSIPLVVGFGGRRAVMNGSVSSAHAIIENNCESCHVSAFGGVPDAACQKCHDAGPHPAKIVDTAKPAKSPRCVDCHVEHQGRGSLAHVRSGDCTSCHSDIAGQASGAKVKNVSAFRAGKHPEFSTASMTDSGLIKLNHAAHMPAAPKTIRGMKLPMKCIDCHQTDRGSATGDLLPVTFERDCKSCHARELEFDIYHVLGPNAPPAPHTRNVQQIRDYVAAAYRNASAPSGSRFGSEARASASASDAARLARESEDFLFTRKCVYCHTAPMNAAQEPYRAYMRTKWLDRGEFDHRAHRAVACESCHKAAKTSTKTADVLIPKMESCLPCHGEARAELDRCGVCHVYHDRAREKDVERTFGGAR